MKGRNASVISTGSGKQIKNIIQLQNKAKARNEQRVFIAEGLRICSEIPKDMLVKIYINETMKQQIDNGSAAMEFEDYEIVANNVFKDMAQTMSPQGILAVVKQPVYSFEKMLFPGKKTLLFLEDVRDPGNLGTIIRTAEGADVDGIIMSKGTVDLFNPKVIRSTMGAVFRMPFVYVDDIKEAIITAKEKDVRFYGAHLKGKEDYAGITYPLRSAVIIGNEANGITDATADMADELVKIPMTGSVESLNAGVAAAVFMYEIYRQRRFG